MRPRITVSTSEDGGLEIWLNEAGRDLLVRKLRGLSAGSDHFRLQPEGLGEVPLGDRAYRAGDRVIEWAKVLFRPDEWDRQHFPHLLGPDGPPGSRSRGTGSAAAATPGGADGEGPAAFLSADATGRRGAALTVPLPRRAAELAIGPRRPPGARRPWIPGADRSGPGRPFDLDRG